MYKWKPSKKKIKEFIKNMDNVEQFCIDNNITQCRDSYYFTINNIEYRVSNHTMQTSNNKAYNCFGEQVREKYHSENDFKTLVCITASKTRIIEIYNNLVNNIKLDKRGNAI